MPRTRDLKDLEQAPDADALLGGKVVFFQPWPVGPSDESLFWWQRLIYLALAEDPAPMPAPPNGALAWLGAALAAAAALLALAPLWLALPFWAGPLLWAGLELGAWPGLLARAACLSLGCLCLGFFLRLELARRRRALLERRFRSRLAPGRWAPWARLLRSGEAALPAAYAALGPAALLRGPAFEAWMARWGLFLDEAPAADGAGFVLAGPGVDEPMALALLDLRRCVPGAGGAVARGTLVFQLGERLGFPDWRVEGAARDRAWLLFRRSAAGRFLLTRDDAAAFGGRFELRPGPGEAADAGEFVQAIGPNAGVWETRGEGGLPGG